MPLLDDAMVLAADIDVTADANGTAVVLATSAFFGANKGQIMEAILRFDGAIEDNSSDEVLDVYIEEYDGTNWYGISRFPRITYDTALKYNSDAMENAGDVARCYFCLSPWATQIRYRVDVTGTIVTGWNDMNIVVVPTMGIPPM